MTTFVVPVVGRLVWLERRSSISTVIRRKMAKDRLANLSLSEFMQVSLGETTATSKGSVSPRGKRTKTTTGSKIARAKSAVPTPKVLASAKVRPSTIPSVQPSKSQQTSAVQPSASQGPASKLQAVKDGTTMYFRDGVRLIDFILVYKTPGTSDHDLSTQRSKERAEFENNLRIAGIDLEHEPSSDGETIFVKVHGTWDFVQRQAEALRIKVPLKDTAAKTLPKLTTSGRLYGRRAATSSPVGNIPRDLTGSTAVFDSRCIDQYDVKSRDTFFTGAQRNLMVWTRLITTSSAGGKIVGIKELIRSSTYEAAYPLHEDLYVKPCCAKRPPSDRPPSDRPPSDRQLLYETWADWRRWYKTQPLTLIRKYFGESVTMYFAWLSFYTTFLIPAAVAGVICMVNGAARLSEDITGNEICDEKGVGGSVMCPSGGTSVDRLWKLSESCLFYRVTHVFDNNLTVGFALFMSVWAMVFLESWNHEQAKLACDWGVQELEMTAKDLEPEKQPTRRLIRLFAAMMAILVFLCLASAFVFGVIVYRLTARAVLNQAGLQGRNALMLSSLTGAGVNAVIMLILDYAYQALAHYLTKLEQPKTERQFEESYALKVYLFQIINHYSSLIYVAFFKGRFMSVVDIGKPFYDNYAEVCDPAGCMIELVVLLSIVMAGKQISDAAIELLLPICRNKYREWMRRRKRQKPLLINTRWEKDFYLTASPSLILFNEYLEMMIQYGFITLFVVAFPLAPLFALINNVFEIRLDAYKLSVAHRRPVATRTPDIGVWYRMMDGIGHLAVLTNACVLAFTSDFVPRMVYEYLHSSDGSLAGYVEFTLSWYDTRPACAKQPDKHKWACVQPYCRFYEYRYPPCSLQDVNVTSPMFTKCDPSNEYPFSLVWWQVMAARFLFVYAFENIVFLVKGIVSILAPDLSPDIVSKMQRERYYEQQLLHMRACIVAGETDVETDSLSTLVCPLSPRRSRGKDSQSEQLLDEVSAKAITATAKTYSLMEAGGTGKEKERTTKKTIPPPARRLHL